MQGYRTQLLGNLPPVIKNLLIANIVVFLADLLISRSGVIKLGDWLALHNFQSEYFSPIQLVTYMFMHGSVAHIFFNMFALVMFGRVLEQVWGGKRFLIYYLVTGIGAALCQNIVGYITLYDLHEEVTAFVASPDPESFIRLLRSHLDRPSDWVERLMADYSDSPDSPYMVSYAVRTANKLFAEMADVPTVGASGAVFGVLLAFGMMFPNVQLMLIFPPIPIKAKWFVLGYGLIELFAIIIPNANDNVAHFAHLGGMLFGFLLIKYWNKRIDTNRDICF
jgi:membrane associated rhomboid family serine protease